MFVCELLLLKDQVSDSESSDSLPEKIVTKKKKKKRTVVKVKQKSKRNAPSKTSQDKNDKHETVGTLATNRLYEDSIDETGDKSNANSVQPMTSSHQMETDKDNVSSLVEEDRGIQKQNDVTTYNIIQYLVQQHFSPHRQVDLYPMSFPHILVQAELEKVSISNVANGGLY